MSNLNVFLYTMIVTALAVLLNGCSAMRPPTLADCGELTDRNVFCLGEKVYDQWEMRSVNAGYLTTGGALALSGLSLGTVAAGRGGAVTGLALGTSALVQIMEIFKFGERSFAYNVGAALVQDARSEYVQGITANGIQNVPSTCISPFGAAYYSKIGAAQKIVEALRIAMLPEQKEIDRAKGKDGVPLPRALGPGKPPCGM